MRCHFRELQELSRLGLKCSKSRVAHHNKTVWCNTHHWSVMNFQLKKWPVTCLEETINLVASRRELQQFHWAKRQSRGTWKCSLLSHSIVEKCEHFIFDSCSQKFVSTAVQAQKLTCSLMFIENSARTVLSVTFLFSMRPSLTSALENMQLQAGVFLRSLI